MRELLELYFDDMKDGMVTCGAERLFEFQTRARVYGALIDIFDSPPVEIKPAAK